MSEERVSRRWVEFLGPILLAALVSYFTASTAVQVSLARLDERERQHYERLVERLDALQNDLRWYQAQPKSGVIVPPTEARP